MLVATMGIRLPGLALGAVNSPLSVMTPPVADQVTPVLLVLVTTAENCSGVPGAIVEVPGVTLTTGTDDVVAAGWDAAVAAGVVAEEHPPVASEGSKMIPARANCRQAETEWKTRRNLGQLILYLETKIRTNARMAKSRVPTVRTLDWDGLKRQITTVRGH